MQKQIILKIYGRVQGVFFRESSRKKARELGLSGLVSNKPDGTVRIVVEGEESKLKEFVGWCKDGPEHAKVDKVEEEWREGGGEFGGFAIK